MFRCEFLKKGGAWLGAARSWIQWNCINGDSVIWGSNEELKQTITVKKLEEAAGHAAYAAIEPFYDTQKGVRQMVIMQMGDGKKIEKIIEDIYKEIDEIKERFHLI